MSRKRRPARKPRPDESIDDSPHGGRPAPFPRRSQTWRMVPFRGRFLSPSTKYVYERLPSAPTSFTAADVAVLCVEADRTLGSSAPCNPAEVIDLLTSRSLVTWTDDGFVKRERPRPRPRA